MTGEALGIVLLLGLSLFLLRDFGWRGAPVFCAIALLFVFSLLFEPLSNLVGQVFSVAEGREYIEHVKDIIKVLGMSYLFGISSDICTSLGEAQIAKAVDVVGRVEILGVVLPYFVEIITLCSEII